MNEIEHHLKCQLSIQVMLIVLFHCRGLYLCCMLGGIYISKSKACRYVFAVAVPRHINQNYISKYINIYVHCH